MLSTFLHEHSPNLFPIKKRYTCVIGDSLPIGVVIGITVGVAIGIAMLIGIVYWCTCKQYCCKPKQEVRYGEPVEGSSAVNHNSSGAQGVPVQESFVENLPPLSGNGGAILFSK